MKILRLLILLIAVGAISFFMHQKAPESYAACMPISGSVQLVSGQWPSGAGGIEVACAGDNPVGPSGCSGGGPQRVMPGGSFSFPKCSCLAGNCLSITSATLPSGCQWVGNTNFCGTNGTPVSAPIQISCAPAPTATPVSSCPDVNPNGSTNECVISTSCKPGQTPKPGGDWACKNHNGGICCTNNPSPTPTNTPTPTPTGVPPTATATLPPSVPTPTTPGVTTPPITSVPPTSPPGGPTRTPTPIRPTNTPPPAPTPTPDFNNAMCKCDQMNVDQISLGQPIKVEAFAKVEGQDTSKAVVKGMKFRIYEGNASKGRVVELPEKGDQPVTVIDNTPSLVRYRAEWTANPTLKVNEEYRIVATPDCQAKTAAAIQKDNQRVVLAARDENVGFFGQIINFFAGLFGRGSETEDEGVQIAEEQGGAIQSIGDFFKPRQNRRGDQLQLDTFTPAQMEKEACNIVKFKFSFTQ